MTSSKSTKRALLTSALAILACVAMLIGTTFAWFTDTASTAVNKIVSGNLHIEIQDEASKKIENLDWKAADNRAQDDILWEPGCTYTLTPFKIVNTGKLALKYKIVVTGLNGDSLLLDVIHFTYKTADGEDFPIDDEKHLGVGEETGMITISASMDKDAGNDYQDKTLKNVKFTVYATQDTVEYDSKDNLYDKDAEYPVVLAANADAFKNGTTFTNAFLQKDAHVILTDDVELNSSITLATENTTLLLDLNGHTLTMKQIYLPNAATVEISDSVGTGAIKFTSQHGIQTNCEGAKVVLNGGTLYASSTYTIYSFTQDKTGTAVMLSKGTSFEMNGGKIVADNVRSDVPEGSIAVRMFGSNTTFTMNGGEIVKTVGNLAAVQASGDGNTTGTKIEINGGSIKSNTVAIYHPQSGSLTVNDGYIEGATAVYAKSGTLTFAGGKLHATAETATPYQYDGNGCYATGDAVVIDACGYPGGNPVVTVSGGTYTVTAEDAHGIAYYQYNGNTAMITNTSGVEIFGQ